MWTLEPAAWFFAGRTQAQDLVSIVEAPFTSGPRWTSRRSAVSVADSMWVRTNTAVTIEYEAVYTLNKDKYEWRNF